MPLTQLQTDIATLLASGRSPDSYLAGGAALHFEPNTLRYSNDLDYFHDSVERVATAFAEDRKQLETAGYEVEIDMNQPGYVRARIVRDTESTKVEWAHDSSWRFMPVERDPIVGYRLHPVDLAINKLLALVGRDEPRDLLDVLDVDERILPLGALCWAAAGKDPGFTPLSILDLLRRRGRFHAEDFARLRLNHPVDLVTLKTAWLRALDDTAQFIASRPANELGCLYYSTGAKTFIAPQPGESDFVPHYGRPGGILPRLESVDDARPL
ncbi:MAG: hypothetical protein AAFZ38_12650 [Myxococcota bacterium]